LILQYRLPKYFVVFGKKIFQLAVWIPMGTNCAPLLAELFLYSYETECIQTFLREKNKPLDVAFNSIFRNINDVLLINNNQLHWYVDSIYPCELEIKDITESSTSASYLDVLLNIDAAGKRNNSVVWQLSFTIVTIWLKSDPRSAPHFFFIFSTRWSEETPFRVTSWWPLFWPIKSQLPYGCTVFRKLRPFC
jgi:hypothetical protein